MKEEKIKVVVKRVDEPADLQIIPNSLGKAQLIVCGDIEIIRLENDVLLICNENGMVLRMKPNFRMNRDMFMGIRGHVFFCTVDSEGAFASLNMEQIVYVFNLLKESKI